MHQKHHLTLTREELYDIVWSKPMSQIAKDYAISDRGLAKLCARKQVPVPPRGYWAKKIANKKATQPPLPAFMDKAPASKVTKQNEPVKVDKKDTIKRKSKAYSFFEERDKGVKKRIKVFRKTLSDGIYYTVRVTSWNSDYSFGLNLSYNPLREYDEISHLYEHPYDEHRRLLIKGDIMEPSQLAGQKIEAHISPRAYLNKENIEKNSRDYQEVLPSSIGSFQRGGHYIMAFISFPDDAFGLLLQSALANKINFMTCHGEKMRYGRGRIYGLSFREEREEEEDGDE